MSNVLSLSNKDAKTFFLKKESYCNFDIPDYFDFGQLLKDVSAHIGDNNIESFYISDRDKHPQHLINVNYKLITNKDGKYAWRPFQLIHPVLYVSLVSVITDKSNWKIIKDRLDVLMKSSRNIECTSMPVVSTYFKKDKAEQIINWSNEVEKKSIINSLDYEYVFHTDIADCYSSIYTHSIPWALHTKEVAKRSRGSNLLGNKIDTILRSMSNGQTNGIPQGSVLMDFLAEIILCYVDSLLSEKISSFKKTDYKIIRYRDDYRIFTNNPQIAEKIIKDLTDTLNDLGMKINSAKTNGMNNVVHSSIKSDKLYWIENGNKYADLQNELYAISLVAQKFPNSGTVTILLKDFHSKVTALLKKDLKNNIKVLISIITDIAYKNPRSYPEATAILSKLIDFLPKNEKASIIKKILNKFKKLPNTGIMQLWLQRITIKLGNGYEYSESLCNKVVDNSVIIWNSDWLTTKLKNKLNSYSLTNKKRIDELSPVISVEEVSLFDKQEQSL